MLAAGRAIGGWLERNWDRTLFFVLLAGALCGVAVDLLRLREGSRTRVFVGLDALFWLAALRAQWLGWRRPADAGWRWWLLAAVISLLALLTQWRGW